MYLVFGLISFYEAAVAAFVFDMDLFMPLSECIQLFVNCGTGLFVWEDSEHLSHKITYGTIYAFIFLGVYLCTPYDKTPLGIFKIAWDTVSSKPPPGVKADPATPYNKKKPFTRSQSMGVPLLSNNVKELDRKIAAMTEQKRQIEKQGTVKPLPPVQTGV